MAVSQNMRIVYPFPMHIGQGFNYMLSIAQTVNAFAKYCPVDLLCLDSPEELRLFFQETLGDYVHPGLNIIQVRNRRLGVKSNKLFFHYSACKHVRKLLSQERKIVVYSRDYKQLFLLLKRFTKEKNLRFVFESHQILSQNYCRKSQFRNAKRYRKLERSVLERVDCLVPITKTLNNEIDEVFHGVTPERIILPVGVSGKFFNADFLPDKKYDLIYAGGFSAWKGIETLLDGLVYVVRDYPDLKALLVGAVGERRKYYHKMVVDYNLANNVEFRGHTPHREMPALLLEARVGIVSGSYREDGLLYTSPLKLYEYLASGLIIVAARIPSLMSAVPEYLVHWAIPDDAESFAGAIISALNEDSNQNRTERIEYAKEHTWERRAQKLIQLLEGSFERVDRR